MNSVNHHQPNHGESNKPGFDRPEFDRPKLSFFGFCTILTLVVILALGILLASATVAYAVGKSIHSPSNGPSSSIKSSDIVNTPVSNASADDADVQTFNGMMTDSYCGARHPSDSNRSSAECVRYCVREGAKFSLLSVNARYEVRGEPEQLEKFVGQRVNVAGTLDGNSITATSIQAAD